jgi:2-phosphosulfolactate phosphatase
MKILRATLSTNNIGTDLVVVIDVLRAFTTAAYLFHAGVKEIYPVSTVHEAFNLRKDLPDCLIVGEVNGIKVQGFDFANSPSEIELVNLCERHVILRTSAGTQGVIQASDAQTILAVALTNVSATIKYIRRLSPSDVTLLQTGLFPNENWGDEDVACADTIENMLLGKVVDWSSIMSRVCLSRSGLHYDGTLPDFPPRDLEMALKFDCFNFAMVVEKRDKLLIMHNTE